MVSHIDYFRVGKTEDIKLSGWVKVRLMGWDIAVMACEQDFVAIEIGRMSNQRVKSFLPDEEHYSKSGAKSLIERFLRGPSGMLWGKLHQFPIRIEDNCVLVGISR
jgi:hypothetical protein